MHATIPAPPLITRSVQDILKAIYDLQGGAAANWVGTSALAARLAQKPASVTNMVQRLARSEALLVEYMPYRGVRLRDAGTKVALEVLRHHRLIELYLAEALGVPWDQVHAEAEALEHVISEDLEERMAAALSDPRLDPHGSPIPARDGRIDARPAVPLSCLNIGDHAGIVEVGDHDPELLRRLGSAGLYPGAHFTVVDRALAGEIGRAHV